MGSYELIMYLPCSLDAMVIQYDGPNFSSIYSLGCGKTEHHPLTTENREHPPFTAYIVLFEPYTKITNSLDLLIQWIIIIFTKLKYNDKIQK